MGDERCEIGPNGALEGSLENQCSMSSNTISTTITTTTTPTHHFSTNVTPNTTATIINSNNNNNNEQDAFPSTTNTHHFTNSNNNNDQNCFIPIQNTTTNTHPFSANPNNNNNNNNEQYRFLQISTRTNNIQHYSSNATAKSSSNNNKEQDRFVPISTSSDNTQNFSTNASSNNYSSNTTSNNKEQDRFLPIANVGRIMKKFIPGNGKISKDAKETVQECVSEFISFVTGEASDKCQREKRKTINGDDIIWAITTLGFEDYVTPLKQYLNKYRELEGEKLNVPKQQRLQQHDQKPNLSYHSVYSSTNLLSQPPFVPSDQPFPLPFSQNSIQAQLPQHEHIDSVGNW